MRGLEYGAFSLQCCGNAEKKYYVIVEYTQ